MKPPKRQYEITLQIGGDDWEKAKHEMLMLADHVAGHGPECNSIMGGCSVHHIVTIEHDPNMTPEKYQQVLAEYMKTIKGAHRDEILDEGR